MPAQRPPAALCGAELSQPNCEAEGRCSSRQVVQLATAAAAAINATAAMLLWPPVTSTTEAAAITKEGVAAAEAETCYWQGRGAHMQTALLVAAMVPLMPSQRKLACV